MPKPDFFLKFKHRTLRADHYLAQAYLEYFAECVESGEEPDKRVTEWIAKAIREYLDEGVRLEDAFALTKPKGRERKLQTVMDELTAALRAEVRIQKGEKRSDAVAAVAQELHASPESVEKSLNKHRNWVKKFTKQSGKEI